MRSSDWSSYDCASNLRRPLEEEAEQDQDKADILRRTDLGIGACSRGRVRLLGSVENAPRRSDKPEAAADEGEAQEMERPEMRVGLPAEQHLEQMPGIVREPVDFGIAALQPAREKVDRQGEAVHLGEEDRKSTRLNSSY